LTEFERAGDQSDLILRQWQAQEFDDAEEEERQKTWR